jgi:hypothetical protein
VVGGLLLLPLAVLVALSIDSRRRADRELQEAIADTDRRDPGWRFDDLEAKQPRLPDEKNGALQVLAARRLLPAGWPAATAKGPSLDDLLEGLEPQQQLDAEQQRVLRAELQAVQPALQVAEGLVDFPEGRFPITWQVASLSSPIDLVQQGRAVARLLQLEAMRRAQDGDADGACRLEPALINSGRSIGQEYSLIAILVRTALLGVATQTLERTLAQGEPDEASLAAAQRLLEREEEETPALTVTAFRGERALQHRMLEAVEKGEVALGGTAPPTLGEHIGNYATSGMVRHSHVVYLRYMTEAVELAKAPGPAQLSRSKELAAAPIDPRAALARLLLPAADKLLGTEWRKLAQLRCAIAAVAVERYRRSEGRWPDSLEALAPRYLRRVPADPYDGRPLRYRRLDDGVIVYSVGPDQTDNGGHLDRKDPLAEGNDLGFRLWDAAHRRQPAPPRPGPPAGEEK